MAYDLFDEVIVANSVSGASTGVKGEMCVGSMRLFVRSVHVVTQTANATTAAVINFIRRPTAGSASGETTIATITVPTTATAGQVYYKDGLNVRLMPGESVVVSVGTAGGAGFTSFSGIINVERSTEVPGNISAMIPSA